MAKFTENLSDTGVSASPVEYPICQPVSIDIVDDVKEVMFGDPELAGRKDGIFVGEFYVYPDNADVIYNWCPLCDCDNGIYGGNRWYTQACCYFNIPDEDISLEVERWVTEHLLAGEDIDEVHTQLTALRTHPPLRSYVERINAILNDERTSAAYNKYLAQENDHIRSDPDWEHERAALGVEGIFVYWPIGEEASLDKSEEVVNG